ncbi:GAP family protein [Micromonospora endolithica]|uniref:GAP family protein n=1 Tax=Micromonospora endolithica TaxID=230091 RepID=A0A3A9YQG4_9ACTN|nr:GAP family protein [Micromonospora endolithica]RKN38232.1 hypothetical protein D7223_31300 [Micromonospora endolithica]TWJ25218.1 Sap-like sulfolipid-1-addressing protein [Micromonospora endolithica]
MSVGLLAQITGLALLDALNPATIAGVALLLLAPMSRPVRAAGMFVVGAYLTVFGLGAVVYLGAGAAAQAVGDGLVWLRRGAFAAAAFALVVAGIRRLRPRIRRAVTVPTWVNSGTSAGLGVLMTGADLPNAFPYFIAIERVVRSGTSWQAGMALLAGYALVYCLPCLVLLVVGALRGDRLRERLRGVYRRLGAERRQPRNVWVAAAYLLGACVLVAIAGTA